MQFPHLKPASSGCALYHGHSAHLSSGPFHVVKPVLRLSVPGPKPSRSSVKSHVRRNQQPGTAHVCLEPGFDLVFLTVALLNTLQAWNFFKGEQQTSKVKSDTDSNLGLMIAIVGCFVAIYAQNAMMSSVGHLQIQLSTTSFV